MELVYLWVEKYKNIENQGFNFSPRFTCKYDEASKELTIDKKEHASIFPENINVTAIVGENGSGKSSLIEIIMLILYNRFDKEYLLIIENKKKELEYIASENKDFPNINYIGKIIQSTEYHLNLISGLRKSFSSNHHVNGIINKTEEYYRGNMSYEQSVLIKTAKVFSNNPDCFSTINKDFVFDKVKFSITKLNTNDIKKELFDKSQELISPIDASIGLLDGFYGNIVKSEGVEEKRLKRIDSPKIIPTDLTKLIIYNTLVGLTKFFSYDQEEAENFLKILKNYQNNIKLNASQIIKDMQNMSEEKDKLEPILDILDNINEFINNDAQKFTFVETVGYEQVIHIADNFDSIEEYIKKYFYLFKGFSEDYFEFQMLNIEFIASKNQDIKFFDLSDGEKRLLSQLIEVQYELLKSAPSYILLLDEPDTSLHPSWNKEFISLLLQIINPSKTIHFIISSHSPFILSDIPKENVIFLEKGKQVYLNIDTFGANIHTLLSHGFFMQDGLMGKFAKGKIEDVINYLNDKESTIKDNDEAQKLLNIIGEPVIKNQLQKMLDSKRLSKIDKLDKLEEELELIKHRIEMIRKNQ